MSATPGPAGAKLGVFVLVAALCTAIVAATLGTPLPGPSTTYEAEFSDVTGLTPGSDVLMAGVRVGRVDAVRLAGATAMVRLEVDATKPVPADGRLAVRYADIVGARAVAVLPGPSGPRATAVQQPDVVIPLARTSPALDLTALLNGFRPLFASLDPGEINRFTEILITTFQGDGGDRGTVQRLLAHTISLTSTISQRGEVIAEVLANLTGIVDHALRTRPDFQQLLDGLTALTAGLAQDRGRIIEAIDAGAELASSLAGLVDELDPELGPLVAAADGAGRTLVDNTGPFAAALHRAPPGWDALMRTAGYGSWVNAYVCALRLDTGPLGDWDLTGGPHSAVCRP